MKFIVRFERVEYKWCEIEVEADDEEAAEEEATNMDVADEEWKTENANESHVVMLATDDDDD